MVKKIILILLGLLGLIVGIPLALGGGGILAVGGKDGSIQSGWHSVSTPTPALVTNASEISNGNVQVTGTTVSIVVEARNSPKPVFLGVARAQDVENYLGNAANDEITKIDFNPYRMETVRETGSLATLPAPGNQKFWVAQSSGTSPALTWEVTSDGNYRAVVMNADGTANVQTELSMGIKAPAIFGAGLGLLIAGLVISLIGLALLIWGIAAKRKKNQPPPPYAPAAAPLAATTAPYASPGTPAHGTPGTPTTYGSAEYASPGTAHSPADYGTPAVHDSPRAPGSSQLPPPEPQAYEPRATDWQSPTDPPTTGKPPASST